MTCAHESAFSIETSPTVFGPGVLEEVGDHAAAMDLRRVALLTDSNLRRTCRLMDNAPRELDKSELATIYRDAMKYW